MHGKDREPGVGLALSGGGFRAALYMLGSLWRLNELGWFPKLKRVTSVSGGSITAGLLGTKWKCLKFDANGVASNFEDEIAAPIRDFCGRNIDVSSGIAGILHFGKNINDIVAGRYDKHLYHGATLQDLPNDEEGPRFVIYATSLQTTSSVRFSKPYLADYKLGQFPDPTISIARAVGASSAFPPVLSPAIFKLDPEKWKASPGAYLYSRENMRKRLVLSDGGVYDNMGLENVWRRYQTVLVADAGAPSFPEDDPSSLWGKQTMRTVDILTEQARSLRKRQLIADYLSGECRGAYWGITTKIDHYALESTMVRDSDLTRSMQTVRTRLNAFSPEEQGHLINWGYALTDAAMRKHVLDDDPGPGRWPIPDFPF